MATQNYDLKGQAVLVTGANRGIGQAVALRLAEEGADVVVNFVNHEDEAVEVVEECRKRGAKAICLHGDVSKVEECRKLVQNSFQQFDHLSFLVNNAGVEKRAPFTEVTEADYDFVMNVNLKGAFFCSQEFTKGLQARKRGGKIVNMSSVHEDLPFPNFASYCASKGALRMLTRTLAVELAPFHINVNGIAPGAIQTPINAKLMHEPELLKALLEKIPLARLGKPEDVAGLAAFLCSKNADYITGSTYFIDGGLTREYHEQ